MCSKSSLLNTYILQCTSASHLELCENFVHYSGIQIALNIDYGTTTLHTHSERRIADIVEATSQIFSTFKKAAVDKSVMFIGGISLLANITS